MLHKYILKKERKKRDNRTLQLKRLWRRGEREKKEREKRREAEREGTA
jgi:hypothetical protein